jgi:hypothetical protein
MPHYVSAFRITNTREVDSGATGRVARDAEVEMFNALVGVPVFREAVL